MRSAFGRRIGPDYPRLEEPVTLYPDEIVETENGEPLVVRRYINAVNIVLSWVGVAAICGLIWLGVYLAVR